LRLLFINAKLQRLLIVVVHREQVVIIIGTAMQHATLKINGGVYQGVSRAAIFGLHMQRVRSEFEIGVVPEDHQLPLCSQTRQTTPAVYATRATKFFAGAFDRVAPHSLL